MGGLLCVCGGGGLDRCADFRQHPGSAWLARSARRQWIFLIEAAPALLLAVICPFFLRDDLAHAQWLTAEEKDLLRQTLAREHSAAAGDNGSPLRLLLDGEMILLVIAYLAIGFGVYANVFFPPLIIKDLGSSWPAARWPSKDG
jgi:hypothetical protein